MLIFLFVLGFIVPLENFALIHIITNFELCSALMAIEQ